MRDSNVVQLRPPVVTPQPEKLRSPWHEVFILLLVVYNILLAAVAFIAGFVLGG